MKLINKRLQGQTFKEYRAYLITQKKWIDTHLKGKLIFDSSGKKTYKKIEDK